LKEQLGQKYPNQEEQKSGWKRELENAHKVEAITKLIHESYVKEIARLKKKIEEDNHMKEKEEAANKENNINAMNPATIKKRKSKLAKDFSKDLVKPSLFSNLT